jgi:hypothetical protein
MIFKLLVGGAKWQHASKTADGKNAVPTSIAKVEGSMVLEF